ncbi:MAG: hypothetical protein E6K79_02390 [Candidatus Eisenbacteria bacterium]|uniref:TolC family protein n=1 Tax=Eiseniibacteriota bacterium TaxID=2212470 RepID=A0A538TT40_UNCEI|nr:MAG: hypothetical protein E6K79_02390 [Candidatus Eisenbacteria bacterium]
MLRPAAAIAIALCLACSEASASSDPKTSSDSLSVRSCAAVALAGSVETQAARWSAAAAAQDATAARRNAAPELRLHSGALIAPSGFYDPAITNLGQYDFKVAMDLRLFDGDQRRRDRARSETSARQADAEFTAASGAAGLEAARLATEVLLARGGIERRRDQELWTARVLEAVRSSARAGLRSPSDVNRLQLDLQTLAMDRADLESAMASSARALGAFLDPASAGARFEAVRDTTWSEASPSEGDSSSVFHRFEGSADVRRAEAAAGFARLDLESARRLKAPQVGLSADAGLAGTDLTRIAPPESGGTGSDLGNRLRRDLGASLSLDMSLPLNRPGLGSTVAAREAEFRAAELRLTRARSTARLGALDLLSRWNDGARRLAAAESAAALAESNLLRVRSLYFAGSVSLLELLDSRRAWLDAADREASARHDLHLVFIESEIAR